MLHQLVPCYAPCPHGEFAQELISFIPRWGWSFVNYRCTGCGELRADSYSVAHAYVFSPSMEHLTYSGASYVEMAPKTGTDGCV